MASVSYETDGAIFELDLLEVIERLSYYATEHNVDEAAQLLDFIAESSEEQVKIPEDYSYFGSIASDLLGKGQGSVNCKACNKTYQSDQLKPTTGGPGKGPPSTDLKDRGGIRKLFGKKQRLSEMSGGRGYECPERHRLISTRSLRT